MASLGDYGEQGSTAQLHLSFLIAVALTRRGNSLIWRHSCHLPAPEHLGEVSGELALPGKVLCKAPLPGGSRTKTSAQTHFVTLPSCMLAGVSSTGTLRMESPDWPHLPPAPSVREH